MHTKKIKERIEKEINNWLDSIEDKDVVRKISRDIIVTGGCIASMLEDGTFKDIDVYFTTKEAAMAVAEYYVAKFNTNEMVKVKVLYHEEEERIKIYIKSVGAVGVLYHDDVVDPDKDDVLPCVEAALKKDKKKNKKTHLPKFLSQNAISLTDKIQIITRFFGSPEEIHKNFDYIHCFNYWTSKHNKIELNKEV